MTATLSDIIQEPGVSLTRNKDGDTLNYTRHVTGLTTTGMGMLKEALTASGVPAIGDSDPVFSDLRLATITPNVLSDEVVALAFTYTGASSNDSGGGGGGGPADANGRRLSFGSSLTTVESNTDADGALVTVTYSGASTNDQDVTQVGTFSVTEATRSFTVSQYETENPIGKIALYPNMINSDVVSLFGETFVGGTLLCTAITAETTDNIETWDVSYSFDYAPILPGGHFSDPGASVFATTSVYYRDPETGRPPDDVRPGIGLSGVKIRNLIAFAQMGIFDGTQA